MAARYEDLRPGTHDQTARLADMSLNHVEAALNYPNIFPRFCGQGFLERDDKGLALECLRIYNDWMIDDWGGGAGRGRLIPLAAAAAVGRRTGRGRGAALRGQGLLRGGLLGEPVQAGPALDVHGRLGLGVAGVRGVRHHGVDAHRLVVVDAVHFARRSSGHIDVAVRAEC